MKKYFTKYLPVDGEIKIGDRVESESINKRKVLVTGITDDGDFITNESDFYEPDHYFVISKDKAKKFTDKLFLCGRDIQVGNEWWHNGKKMDRLFDDEDLFDYNEYETFRDNSFVVIGEISPDAGWVREGDVFYQEEVRVKFREGYFTEKQFTLENGKVFYGNSPNKAPIYILLKGPCGHFH